MLKTHIPTISMKVIIAIRKLALGQKPQFREFQQSELSHLSQYTNEREEGLWRAEEEKFINVAPWRRTEKRV